MDFQQRRRRRQINTWAKVFLTVFSTKPKVFMKKIREHMRNCFFSKKKYSKSI